MPVVSRLKEPLRSMKVHRPKSPLQEFSEGFGRSHKGNLWRKYMLADGREVTLTVHYQSDGRFGYCLADRGGPHFSDRLFDSEDDAMCALWEAVKQWEQPA